MERENDKVLRLQETNHRQETHRIPPGQELWRNSQAQSGCRVRGVRGKDKSK